MVNVRIFYDHLEYFMAILYIFCLFGIVCGHLFYFSQFGMFGPRKIWQPCSERLYTTSNCEKGRNVFESNQKMSTTPISLISSNYPVHPISDVSV
jgi:hypothetical protein